MRKWSWVERQIACGLILIMAVPVGWAATDPLPSAPVPHTGTVSNADDQSSAPQNQNGQQPPASQQNQNQQNPNAPVGTAAAPVVTPEGAPASRPAGAAIAPIKQRRTRSLAIRVGLLVGAGVAIGTVAGLTLGSSSRPH